MNAGVCAGARSWCWRCETAGRGCHLPAESETGVETKPACGSATIKFVEHDGSHLISHSQEPLFSKAETQAIIDEAEERAERMGGWTTKRHARRQHQNYEAPPAMQRRRQPRG